MRADEKQMFFLHFHAEMAFARRVDFERLFAQILSKSLSFKSLRVELNVARSAV